MTPITTTHALTTLCASFVAAALLIVATTSVDAGWRRDRNADIYDGRVVAESRHGNGTVSGRVREARNGLQVQLPSGTWIYCRSSCSETLRVSTIDQWENQGSMIGAGTAQAECGFFGCIDFSWGF